MLSTYNPGTTLNILHPISPFVLSNVLEVAMTYKPPGSFHKGGNWNRQDEFLCLDSSWLGQEAVWYCSRYICSHPFTTHLLTLRALDFTLAIGLYSVLWPRLASNSFCSWDHLELLILLPPSAPSLSKCWHYRHKPSHPIFPFIYLIIYLFIYLETGSHCVVWDGLKLTVILQPHLPRCWNYKHSYHAQLFYFKDSFKPSMKLLYYKYYQYLTQRIKWKHESVMIWINNWINKWRSNST